MNCIDKGPLNLLSSLQVYFTYLALLPSKSSSGLPYTFAAKLKVFIYIKQFYFLKIRYSKRFFFQFTRREKKKVEDCKESGKVEDST